MDNQTLFHTFVTFLTAVHQAQHELTKDIKPDFITPLQYSILEYIAVSQPVTLSAISDCMHQSMPNTSREIRKLGDKHLVEKSTAPEDQRKQYIRLSAEGQALMDGIFARLEVRFLQRLGDTTAEDRAALGRAMTLIHSKVLDPDASTS